MSSNLIHGTKVVNMRDKIEGFILLIEYPGCKKRKGDFEPYTSGEFLHYPKIWKPVYKKSFIREQKIEKIISKPMNRFLFNRTKNK